MLVGDGARQVAANEGARLHLRKLCAAKGRAPAYSTPALPAPLRERVYVDACEAGDENDLDDRRLEQNDCEAGEDCDVPLPGLRERTAAYAPSRDTDERDDRRVQSVEEFLCVRELAQVSVEYREQYHQKHRGQNKARHRHRRAAPTAQTQTDVCRDVVRH